MLLLKEQKQNFIFRAHRTRHFLLMLHSNLGIIINPLNLSFLINLRQPQVLLPLRNILV